MGKVMRHTLGASLNIRHNLSSSKGPKPLQLKLLTTYIPRRAPLRLPLVPRNGCGRPGRAPERFLPRSEERFSRNAETDLVCRLLLEKKKSEHVWLTEQAQEPAEITAIGPHRNRRLIAGEKRERGPDAVNGRLIIQMIAQIISEILLLSAANSDNNVSRFTCMDLIQQTEILLNSD